MMWYLKIGFNVNITFIWLDFSSFLLLCVAVKNTVEQERIVIFVILL